MRRATWIDGETMIRFNRIMEASGYFFSDYEHGSGAYLMNVLDRFPKDQHVAKCAMAKAIHLRRLNISQADALDDVDLKNPIELD